MEETATPRQSSPHRYDLIVIGAGPAGLCFSRSLADSGLRIALVERQREATLADPAFDGREIALTQGSAAMLRQLDVWRRMPADAIAPLRDAVVENGHSGGLLNIDHQLGGQTELGFLVANHLIRRAAWAAVQDQHNVDRFLQTGVNAVRTDANHAEVRLDDGRRLQAALIVAADSRYSETRRAMGIPARSTDFGKTMLVCNMALEQPHEQIARECFAYGHTLALLPRNGNSASVVITLPGERIAALLDLEPERFARHVEGLIDGRFGRMRLESTRHAYPLVAVYADRFVAPRFALLGDAAVGMHPVTAHGFNFGLSGQALLSREIRKALDAGRDIGGSDGLARYQSQHRRATWPLYLSTNAIAKLFTDDRLPARVVRGAALRMADRLLPFKRAVAASLTRATRP